jgi:large subunit ribosomal protein L24
MQRLKPTSKPSKQRKLFYQAPDHSRRKLFSALLSPQLRASHGIKNLPVRNGDTVRIMRGDHKGFEGKITKMDRGECRIYVEGLTREKVDGTTISVPIHPSKVTITSLVLDDKWRKKTVERKAEARKAIEKTEAKPAEETAKIEEKPREEPSKRKVVPKKTRAKQPRAKKKPASEKQAKPKTRKKSKVEAKQRTEAKTQEKRQKTAEQSGGA